MEKNLTTKSAAILANGAWCSPTLMSAILSRVQKIVALDGAIDRTLAADIPLDVWLGDFDSTVLDRIVIPPHVLRHHSPDQSKTDLEKAIEYLIGIGFQDIYVLGATGRRADHTLNNLTGIVRYQQQAQIRLIDDHSVVHPIPSGFTQAYPQGTILSLMPIGIVTGAHSNGLVYELSNDTLTIGYRTSSSNAAASNDPITIHYESGDLLLMVCWDDPVSHAYYPLLS